MAWSGRIRGFLREAITPLGQPWADPRRYQLALLCHVIAAPLLVFAPTAWMYATEPIFLTPGPASWAIRTIWFPACGALVVLAALGSLVPVRDEGSFEHGLQKLAMLSIVVLGGLSNGVTTWLYGSLTSVSAALFVILIAVYRVFVDYATGVSTMVWTAVVFVVIATSELQGWIPVQPLLPEPLGHPAYTNPTVGAVMVQGAPASLLLIFLATNYGMNQSLLLHRYITDSVLRRYLPESMVRRASKGELDLDGVPERREVTVVFADLVGFTALSERLGAEAVGDLLNRYLGGIAEIAHGHGATVDKFVGDGVMLVFGAPEPLAAREQAEQALALARDILRAVDGLESPEPLKARVGVNTGDVVVGNFGSTFRSDYTVIGPAVNVAARLESACDPGRILLGERTASLLCLPGEGRSYQLKGVSEPVRAWFAD